VLRLLIYKRKRAGILGLVDRRGRTGSRGAHESDVNKQIDKREMGNRLLSDLLGSIYKQICRDSESDKAAYHHQTP
jgi:hypothetical protein